MPDNVYNLPGGVGIMDLSLIRHSPQLREGFDYPPHNVFRDVGPVLFQHCELRLHARIVHNVARVQIAKSSEKIIA